MRNRKSTNLFITFFIIFLCAITILVGIQSFWGDDDSISLESVVSDDMLQNQITSFTVYGYDKALLVVNLFNDEKNPCDGYIIFYKQDSQSWEDAVEEAITDTPYVGCTGEYRTILEDLLPNTKYECKVVPYQNVGDNSIFVSELESNEVSLTMPASKKLTLLDEGEYKISWEAVPGVTRYRITYVLVNEDGTTSDLINAYVDSTEIFVPENTKSVTVSTEAWVYETGDDGQEVEKHILGPTSDPIQYQ